MKVTLKPVVDGWVVDWTPAGGKRKRRFFETKKDGEAEKATIEKQHKESGEVWMALDAKERVEIGLLIRRGKEVGYTLRQACDFYEQGRSATPTATLRVAFNKFIAEKEARRLALRSIQSLKSNIGRFVSGRDEYQISRISRDDLVTHLQNPKWGPRTYNTYLISFRTFFKWCVELGFITKSPAASVKSIGKKQMPDIDKEPAILKTEQCANLLRAALEIDRGMIPYVVVGIFAGLRPMKEAGKLLREDIEAKTILVRGSNAKDRKRRHVSVPPILLAWLKIALKSRAQFPPKNLRRRFEALRARAGLIKLIKVPGKERKLIESTGWEQDCLRHTFASHYLPVFGAEKTIEEMGHGDYGMLFTHYRKLISKADADKFWTDLTPANIIGRLFDPEAIHGPTAAPVVQ